MRAIVAAAALALALAVGAAGQSPNVLVILADDLGVDSIGCYQEGNDLPATPNLDALAARGVLFRNAYAFPSCSPTRAAILTGRHPARSLVGRWILHENNTSPAVGTLRPAEHTIPELLDRAGSGYAHACIGKWHLHDATFGVNAPVTIAGFGHFTGFRSGQLPSYYAWPRVAGGVEQTCTVYATTQQTDDAIAWITARTTPWFCYLAYNAPHLPMQAPPAHLTPRVLGGNPTNRQLYLATIEALDTEIGRLFAAMGPARLANTHVVFLGDNGSIQNFAVPPFLGNRAKGTPYEGGVNVPLVYAGPAVVLPGREVAALACAADVFSTVLELAGGSGAVPPWLTVDGVSLVPYFGNPAATPLRGFAFTEEFTGRTWPAPNTNGHATVRNSRFKLIHRYGGSQELFDLQADPFEQQNLLQGVLSSTQQQNYQALLAEITRIRTPLARATPFGSACAGSRGDPVIGCSAVPRFGTTIQIQLGNAPANAAAILAVGLSHTAAGIVPLPRDLSPWGMAPGCMQWFSLDSTRFVVADAAGLAAVPLAVPNQPGLLETTLFHGYWVLDPAAPNNPLGLATTAPVAVVLGL